MFHLFILYDLKWKSIMWLIWSNSNWNQFIFTFDEHSFCSLFSALYILLCYFIFIGLFPLIFPLVIYFEFLSKYDLIPWHVWSCVNNKNYDKQIKVRFVHSLIHRFNNKLNRVKKSVFRTSNYEIRVHRLSKVFMYHDEKICAVILTVCFAALKS